MLSSASNKTNPFTPGAWSIVQTMPVRFAISSDSTSAGTRKASLPGGTATLIRFRLVCADTQNVSISASTATATLVMETYLSPVSYERFRCEAEQTLEKLKRTRVAMANRSSALFERSEVNPILRTHREQALRPDEPNDGMQIALHTTPRLCLGRRQLPFHQPDLGNH